MNGFASCFDTAAGKTVSYLCEDYRLVRRAIPQNERAIDWLRQTGVTVEPIEKNVIE